MAADLLNQPLTPCTQAIGAGNQGKPGVLPGSVHHLFLCPSFTGLVMLTPCGVQFGVHVRDHSKERLSSVLIYTCRDFLLHTQGCPVVHPPPPRKRQKSSGWGLPSAYRKYSGSEHRHSHWNSGCIGQRGQQDGLKGNIGSVAPPHSAGKVPGSRDFVTMCTGRWELRWPRG
jgi:hypothetical protein